MPDPTGEGRRRPLPFGLHQGLEYLVGILLALTAIRLPADEAIPGLVVAVVVMALALVTDGPLGGFRVVGRALHRALDVVLVMVLAASPVFLGWGDVTTVVLAETMAVIYAALVVRTSYAPPRRRVDGAAPAAPTAPTAPPPVVAQTARAAGRAAGRTAGKVGRQAPRALGRAVGRRTKR